MSGEDLEAADAALAPRDALGRVCHTLHLIILVYFIAGWAVPWSPALWFYLGFVPAVALQWQFNADACILNNLESWLRSGRWRDPANKEEGAWIATLVEGWTGYRPGPLLVSLVVYAGLLALWAMALIHMLYF